jgi:alkanesulfonate monooxygenase SsuD/methylene tetrahydromethanopterin reductase-like flavin-dependent oxidoreductase (luciferase family)
MVRFELRYALRQPPSEGNDFQRRYQACIEQAEWGDKLGFHSIMISEHHGSLDGYMSSPMVLGSAIASRTKSIRIRISSLIAPLHNPVRLAEDLATLDIISNGRLDPLLSGGYVGYEFEAMGTSLRKRREYMEEIVPFLRKAWTGELFDWKGKTIRVTPKPVQRPAPPIWMGGASKVAARRAARLADRFHPSYDDLFETYCEELDKLGKPRTAFPGPNIIVWVAEDPEKFWTEFGPSALHENNSYGKWYADWKAWNGYETVPDTDALRETGLYPVLTPDELVRKIGEFGPDACIQFHPMAGGFDPDLAWESLKLVEDKVLPALRGKE